MVGAPSGRPGSLLLVGDGAGDALGVGVDAAEALDEGHLEAEDGDPVAVGVVEAGFLVAVGGVGDLPDLLPAGDDLSGEGGVIVAEGADRCRRRRWTTSL